MVLLALHQAIQDGNISKIKKLIQEKVDINEKNTNGNTPLHSAILRKNFDIVKTLIENGADVNAKGIKNKSPLYIALEYRFAHTLKFVKLLVSSGAKYDDQYIFLALKFPDLLEYLDPFLILFQQQH